MNDTLQKLAKALGTIAPTLATMLGGPLAGTAVTAITAALGMGQDATADQITKVVQTGMTPEAIAAIRAADQHHAEVLEQQKIDVLKLNQAHEEAFAKIDADDRADARKRETVLGGYTTPALAWLVVTASVSLGAAIILGAVTKDPTQATLVGTVIGYVFSEAKQVLAYYFGSSASSRNKDDLLYRSTPVDK